jgi:hypothetical protein
MAALDADFTAHALLAATAPPLFAYQRRDLGYSIERIAVGLRRLFLNRGNTTASASP